MQTRSKLPNAVKRPNPTKSLHTRPSRHRTSISYRETVSEESDYSADELRIFLPKPKRTRVTRPASQSTVQRYGPSKSSNESSSVTKQCASAKVEKNVGEEINTNGNVCTRKIDAKIPAWQTLPYEILLQIFHYAAQPLWDDQLQPTPAIVWLLRTALVCKSFSEPALSILYYAPPLSPPTRAHDLLAHLSSHNGGHLFNYHSKIKYLDIEALSVLGRKCCGEDPIDLATLVAYTPQLRGIGLHLLSDHPKYNKKYEGRVKKLETVYKLETFDMLDTHKISLLSWKWNFGLIGSQHNLSLRDVHSRPSFRNLSELVLLGYSEKSQVKPTLLIDALNTLSQLKRLSLELSSWSDDEFLLSLPHHLEALQVIDCPSLTSERLHLFLATKGNDLRELVLNHNQSLNLAFVVDIATTCPKLETLRMNLRCYSSYVTIADVEPKFEALLLPHELPTWPSSLQILDLQYLRKWHSDTAEMFFQSLVDSAATLPCFRRLTIKAIVDIDWRDRASFRGKWESRLKQVFLRHSSPPNPRFQSIQSFYDSKPAFPKVQIYNGDLKDDGINHGLSKTRSVGSRRFSHIAVVEKPKNDVGDSDSNCNSDNDSDSNNDSPIAPRRRSNRLKNQDDNAYICPGEPEGKGKAKPRRRVRKRKRSDSVSSSDDSALEDETGSEINPQSKIKDENLYIQGLCDVVAIQIDNLRPAEEQFHENDFLDEEKSGDEDWDGDA